jgi:hypothetical protein
MFIEGEDPARFDAVKEALNQEHQPQTATEQLLVEKMAQHHWLSQRALDLQTSMMVLDYADPEVQKRVDNYTRYQVQHDRMFQRALHDLLKLRAERRKAQIGFESQKQAEAKTASLEAGEKRKTERHEIDIEIRKARLEREKSHAVVSALAAADKMEGCLPPGWEKIAA